MLSPEEHRELYEKSVKVKYNKREVICKQGGLVSHVMFMEEGLAKVFLDNGCNSLLLKIIPPGNFIGLSSVSEQNQIYMYSSMAYIDSDIRQIDVNFFRKLLQQNALFAKEVIDIMSANSAQIYGRFFCMTHKQAYGRLADIILCISERIFKQDEFELPLSRKDLAELSGLSSETVIRMLKKFHEDNLIHMDGKAFRLIDPERLRRISETG
jgi:CRP/FNR family transcriptional regulator